jgi:hypothetical protein
MLLTWRVWHSRNEATHDKPVPSVEISVNFLCGYLKLLQNIRGSPTDQILRGKRPVLDIYTPPVVNHVVVPQDIPWSRPPSGWVKLTIDGSFKLEDGHGDTSMILHNETGQIIFSA